MHRGTIAAYGFDRSRDRARFAHECSARNLLDQQPLTLGGLLDVDPHDPPVPEKAWVRLVQYVAAGDHSALRELYERAREPVHTLIERITSSEAAADELTVSVFCDLWRRAPSFDPLADTVFRWIMKLARARALEDVRLAGGQPLGSSRAPERNGAEPDPAQSAWERLAQRLPAASGAPIGSAGRWTEPEWREVAPGITCKLLAADAHSDRVSLLVRLASGIAYPPHRHAGIEELHVLDGELWIEDRKLYSGAFTRAGPGTSDGRVWSETGCICVLITSRRDALG